MDEGLRRGHGWNPKMEVDGSNDFPFQLGGFIFPVVDFQWCIIVTITRS